MGSGARCESCGTDDPGSGRFCVKCGAPTGPGNAPTLVTPPGSKRTQRREPKDAPASALPKLTDGKPGEPSADRNRRNRWIIGAAALIVVALVAGGAYYVLNGDDPSTSQSASVAGLSAVRIGATRDEVIRAAGQPIEVVTSGSHSETGTETETYLIYKQGTVVLAADDTVNRILEAGARPGSSGAGNDGQPTASREESIRELQRYAERSTSGRSAVKNQDYAEAVRIRSGLVRDLKDFQASPNLDPDVASTTSLFAAAMEESLRQNRICKSGGLQACEEIDVTQIDALKAELANKLNQLLREVGGPTYSGQEL